MRRTDDGSAHHTQHVLLQTAVRRTLTHINTHTTRYPNKPRLVTREDSSPTPPTFSAGETKPNGYTSCQSAAQLKPHEQVQTARIARQLRTETPNYLSIYPSIYLYIYIYIYKRDVRKIERAAQSHVVSAQLLRRRQLHGNLGNIQTNMTCTRSARLGFPCLHRP